MLKNATQTKIIKKHINIFGDIPNILEDSGKGSHTNSSCNKHIHLITIDVLQKTH